MTRNSPAKRNQRSSARPPPQRAAVRRRASNPAIEGQGPRRRGETRPAPGRDCLSGSIPRALDTRRVVRVASAAHQKFRSTGAASQPQGSEACGRVSLLRNESFWVTQALRLGSSVVRDYILGTRECQFGMVMACAWSASQGATVIARGGFSRGKRRTGTTDPKASAATPG